MRRAAWQSPRGPRCAQRGTYPTLPSQAGTQPGPPGRCLIHPDLKIGPQVPVGPPGSGVGQIGVGLVPPCKGGPPPFGARRQQASALWPGLQPGTSVSQESRSEGRVTRQISKNPDLNPNPPIHSNPRCHTWSEAMAPAPVRSPKPQAGGYLGPFTSLVPWSRARQRKQASADQSGGKPPHSKTVAGIREQSVDPG